MRQTGIRSIQIPASSREIKAYYWERPNRPLISEFLDELRAGVLPHLCSFHTHTKPSPNSNLEYLAEFEVAERLVKAGYWSPCPCCTPNAMKFFRRGKIGWFPDEGVVRILGPNCFAGLAPEAHQRALNNLRRQKADEARLDDLLANFDRLESAYRCFSAAARAAKGFDKLGAEIRFKVYEKLGLKLWQEVRESGQLKVWSKTTRLNKQNNIEEFEDRKYLGTLRGFELFNPEAEPISPGFLNSAGDLAIIDGLDEKSWRRWVQGQSAEEREMLSKKVNEAIRRGKLQLTKMRDLQMFLRTENLATLRRWSQDDGCNLTFEFSFIAEREIRFVTTNDFQKILFPAAVYNHIPQMKR